MMCFHYYLLALVLYFIIPPYALHSLSTAQNKSEDKIIPVQIQPEKQDGEEMNSNRRDTEMKNLLKEIKILKQTIEGMEEKTKRQDKNLESLATSIVFIIDSLGELSIPKPLKLEPKTILSTPVIVNAVLSPILAKTNLKLLRLETLLKVHNNVIFSIPPNKSTTPP